MINGRRQLISWVVGVVFILSLYVSDFWVSFIFAVIIALFRDEAYEKECFKIYSSKNRKFILKMKFLSMVIGMSILLYVVYTIIKNDYEYLNNSSLMMTCIALIASPVLIILIKFEVELYSHYKKRDDVKK